MSQTRGSGPAQRATPVSALPSQLARALAFVAIVVGGLAGAVIGFGVAKVSCTGDCSAQKAGGSIIGALFIGVGIAIVAVLVLRAMGEWNAVKEREANVTLGNRASLRQPGRNSGPIRQPAVGRNPPSPDTTATFPNTADRPEANDPS
jgi:hypothetical protein